MEIESKYLDVKSAGQYLGLSERFVRRLVAERRIAYHKAGARVMFAREDLDAYMAASRIEPITRQAVARTWQAVA